MDHNVIHVPTKRDAGVFPVHPRIEGIVHEQANLFMHYAFDAWMDREHPGITFCRYVDDVVVHAVTLRQAERLRSAISERMAEVGLMLHPVKTKIVYCQDNKRRGSYEHESFTFLGLSLIHISEPTRPY